MNWLLPNSRAGHLALWLISVFFILLFFLVLFTISWNVFEWEEAQSVFIPATVVLMGASAFSAFGASLVSIFKYKERSWLVFGCFMIGLVAIFFAVGEIFPH
jgi:hypothetical protein